MIETINPCVCVREWVCAFEFWLLAASGGTLRGICGVCVGAITPCIRCVVLEIELERVEERRRPS